MIAVAVAAAAAHAALLALLLLLLLFTVLFDLSAQSSTLLDPRYTFYAL